MKTVEVRGRDQLDEVVVTGFVLRQEREMVSRVALIARPVLDHARRHVSLAADDGLDARVLCCLVKFDRAVEIPVIGNCHRRHLEFGRLFHQLLRPHQAIEEGIFRVKMEVNEGIGRHSTAL